MHVNQKLLNRFTYNFLGSVKVYTHCVCEISQRSESNCTFENQKIEITCENYSSLNTWVTLMKQKLNYSHYVEQEQDIFRYVKNSELTRKIRRHSDWIFHIYISVTNGIVPPFRIMVCFQPFNSVWEFSKLLLVNFGMFAISDCLFIQSVICLWF